MAQMGLPKKVDAMALVRSVLLTVIAIIATYPAITFLLRYSTDQNTGTLIIGCSFFCLQLCCGAGQVRHIQKFSKKTTKRNSAC